MAEKTWGKVLDVAKRIVVVNHPYYSDDFIGLLPRELLDRRLDDGNLHKTSVDIDKLRFQREEELLRLLGKSTIKLTKAIVDELRDIINNKDRFGDLSPEQQQKAKEIKFLNNVAQTVLHR